MSRLLVLSVFAIAAVLAEGTYTPALSEFRFSSQRSLMKPDPFLPQKKKRNSPQQVTEPNIKIIPASLVIGPILQPAPNLTSKSQSNFDPRLNSLIEKIESHFSAKVLISSGCRSAEHNRAVGGALNSFHLKCMAADISIPGVTTAQIRDFAMSMPERGGVGTYCSTPIVHVDVGPKRQWYWACGYKDSQMARFDLH